MSTTTTNSISTEIPTAVQGPAPQGRVSDDTKLIAAVCAVTVGITAVLTGAIAAFYSVASPDQLEMLTTMMQGYGSGM